MRSLVQKFIVDELGATAIEYGLIAALVSLAIITGVTSVGVELSNLFNSVGDDVATILP